MGRTYNQATKVTIWDEPHFYRMQLILDNSQTAVMGAFEYQDQSFIQFYCSSRLENLYDLEFDKDLSSQELLYFMAAHGFVNVITDENGSLKEANVIAPAMASSDLIEILQAEALKAVAFFNQVNRNIAQFYNQDVPKPIVPSFSFE